MRVRRLMQTDDSDQGSNMVLIEIEGLLYRGHSANHPLEIWDYPRGRWVPFAEAGVMRQGRGKQIDAQAAEKLKVNNADAEHYMYYDTPPWLQPLGQAYRDAVLPEHIKKRIAERSRDKPK